MLSNCNAFLKIILQFSNGEIINRIRECLSLTKLTCLITNDFKFSTIQRLTDILFTLKEQQLHNLMCKDYLRLQLESVQTLRKHY